MTATTPERQLETDHVVVWSEDAANTLMAMAHHVAALGSAYGQDHHWHIEAAASFARITRDLVGFRNLRVTKDGPLSLLGIAYNKSPAGGLTFGLIFHGVDRRCTKDDCHAILSDEGNVWKYMPDYSVCEDGEHSWLFPLGAPRPGTWSFHS